MYLHTVSYLTYSDLTETKRRRLDLKERELALAEKKLEFARQQEANRHKEQLAILDLLQRQLRSVEPTDF